MILESLCAWLNLVLFKYFKVIKLSIYINMFEDIKCFIIHSISTQ